MFDRVHRLEPLPGAWELTNTIFIMRCQYDPQRTESSSY